MVRLWLFPLSVVETATNGAKLPPHGLENGANGAGRWRQSWREWRYGWHQSWQEWRYGWHQSWREWRYGWRQLN